MSAPSDRLHDPNSVSFYAGEGQRAVRVAQVSEAAGLGTIAVRTRPPTCPKKIQRNSG
jgi:hypothetical protein